MEKNRRRNLYSTLNAKYDLSPVLKGLGLFGTVSFDAYETFESTQTAQMDSWNYDYDNLAVTVQPVQVYQIYNQGSFEQPIS